MGYFKFGKSNEPSHPSPRRSPREGEGESASRGLADLLTSFGCSFGFLFFEHSIDGLIEDIAITLHIDAIRIGAAFDGIKPADAVRVFADEFDVVAQGRIAAAKLSGRDTEQIRDRFESLHPAND